MSGSKARMAVRSIGIGMVLSISPGTAYASASSTQTTSGPRTASSEIRAVETAMTLDCEAFRGNVRKYAIEHGYCPMPDSPGKPSPYNTVYGACGSAFIYIEDPNWESYTAKFRYGFRSTLGTVVARSLAVGYVGPKGPGGFSDSGFMASSSYSRTSGKYTTGSGYLTATLGGKVTLFWGGTCTLLQPTDGEYIN